MTARIFSKLLLVALCLLAVAMAAVDYFAMGVVRSSGRRFTNQAEAAAVATEMKNYAKRRPGSTYEIDRRGPESREAGGDAA